MPAIKRTPTYLLHKPTGQARVRIDGKDHYLGPYNSPESRERFDELVTTWLRQHEVAKVSLTIDELVLLYLDFARGYYVKDGKPTSEIHDLRAAVKPLVKLFGTTRVRDFGPLKLKSVRDRMVAAEWSRGTVNAAIHRIRRIFRWGVENEHVPPETLVGLSAVAALKKGKSTAKDRPPIMPVDDKTVEATLPHLSVVVGDMVRLQRVTGMRPAEVCLIRPCDVDRTDKVWSYRPSSHKTEHHGRERVIFIGPQGQAILTRYLLREATSFCFSPVEAEKERRSDRHEQRTTPLHYGNRPGKVLVEDPQRKPGERYTTNTYAVAIRRACDRAFPIPAEIKADSKAVKEWRKSHQWSPNRLRHSFATLVRKQFGLEAAQILLGHSAADVTQIYAERDAGKAKIVAHAVG